MAKKGFADERILAFGRAVDKINNDTEAKIKATKKYERLGKKVKKDQKRTGKIMKHNARVNAALNEPRRNVAEFTASYYAQASSLENEK